MALSTRGKLLAFGALTVGVVSLSYAASRAHRDRASGKKPAIKEAPLEGVYEEGARIPERVAGDVQLPIDFSFAPRMMTLGGEIVEGEPRVDSEGHLASLVTDISHERANIAYEFIFHLVANEGYDLANPQILDEVVQRTVSLIAPRVDWARGLEPYAYDSPEGLVWRGVQLLAELAYQTHWNKQALA